MVDVEVSLAPFRQRNKHKITLLALPFISTDFPSLLLAVFQVCDYRNELETMFSCVFFVNILSRSARNKRKATIGPLSVFKSRIGQGPFYTALDCCYRPALAVSFVEFLILSNTEFSLFFVLPVASYTKQQEQQQQ